ncbi:MAG: hypothetical protein LBT09_00355 [Planctomycetaceae bacterium]|jgi:hypothetical protein|nr:hypothetical protein [Planctomycetaceae bacterium]
MRNWVERSSNGKNHQQVDDFIALFNALPVGEYVNTYGSRHLGKRAAAISGCAVSF